LLKQDRTGVVQQLSDKEPAAQLAVQPKLAALWRILIPAAERSALTDGTCKRLIVVPDGSLALVPFEALVVEPGNEPKYLLDAGPPVVYAPSAAVLYNLSRRPAPTDSAPRLLTVGDPAYPLPAQVATARGAATGPATGSRYRTTGGGLARLPHSGTESTWVAEAFGKQGATTTRLAGQQATEGAVRSAVSGQRIVHLACHGMADQSHGNFFGALALAPGKNAASNPADDGFLTLPEIYELNLKDCELTILSACETNYGPEQQGEGVWALSRGFLVAGARRVVASNWLVDDEAAASLVSVFCDRIAKDQKSGQADYAQALHAAKKWVRNQDKWKSPYYWGTFVLVGPN
jgi:CHAT domain-containing protein